MHEIVIKRGGNLETYHDFDSIPEDVEHVIKCILDIPPEPHTEEQHKEIHQCQENFRKLIEKCNG